MTKCEFHVPALAGVRQEQLPDHMQEALRLVRYNPDGITLLGTLSGRGLDTPLTVTDEGAPQLTRRARQAVRLGRALCDMIALAPPAGAKQPAWYMAASQVAHALDYDARVLPCSLVEQYASEVGHAALPGVEAVAEARWDDLSVQQQEQLGMPV